MATTAITHGGRRVRVSWADGTSRDFAAPWLFDHAEQARDPVSGQRGHGASALAGAAEVAEAAIDGETLALTFSPSGARRSVALARLRDAAPAIAAIEHWPTPAPIAAAAPVAFAAYMSDDAALREALSRVARHGFALLAGAGDDPDAVLKAVARFGYVRETNYGRTFDVRVAPDPGNLAYTDRALDLHTDNPYRDPVPTLQLLHAIVAEADGGATLFVDGFAAAEALRREDPEAFDLLSRTPARFTYAEPSGARLSNTAPVLGLDAAGAIQIVRLNHRSLDLDPGEAGATEAWYGAYLDLYARLHDPAAAYERRLAPGEMVLFDNRRIVHGRRGLAERSPRWLRGCYADMDGLKATLARVSDQKIA